MSSSPAAAVSWDGQNPNLTSCWQSATIAKKKTSHSGKFWVSLIYSTKCRTVWVEVGGDFPYANGASFSGYVKRNSDGKKYNLGSMTSGKWGYSANGSLTWVRWSPMLNDANVSSFASGRFASEAWLTTASY
ncbi:MAG: hypothetical protein CVT62_01080 [Actinobacteria bacterium HGW-Actinobacteria-2]|nr:MAG: hypothetical protein CVT62_01080 [Actinobacteria bacterium HGW-Actinobacteria-2]